MIHRVFPALLAASVACLAQAPFELVKALPFPATAADSGVGLGKVHHVFSVSPGFFVFIAETTVASPGAFNTGWGLFSWKNGALKTVTLDIKGFKALHGDPFPEKASFMTDRMRVEVGGNQIFFTVATGWVAHQPDAIQAWAGGLYAWDGERIRKLLAPGDTVMWGGTSQKVVAANLQHLLPGGGAVLVLGTEKGRCVAHWKDGAVTPLLAEGAPLPGMPDVTVDRILRTFPSREADASLLCEIEPKKGKALVVVAHPKGVRLVLANREADPTSTQDRIAHVASAVAGGVNRALLHVGLHKGGSVDRGRTKVMLWEDGRFKSLHESDDEIRASGPENLRQERLTGAWWTEMGALFLLRKRIDATTSASLLKHASATGTSAVADAGPLPNFGPDLLEVPGEKSARVLVGGFSRQFPQQAPQPVAYLWEEGRPDRLQPLTALKAANGTPFRLSDLRGEVALLGDGLYLRK